MTTAILAVILSIIAQVLSETEDHVNFHEIFTDSLSLMTDDVTMAVKDDEFHLGPLPTQYVDLPSSKLLHPDALGQVALKPDPRLPTPTFMKLLKPSDVPEEVSVKSKTTNSISTSTGITTTSTATTTTAPTEVLPIKQEKGILDVLFPAARVKNFKNIFETMKRVLSYTF